jgi:PPOX class probable F420-dependent enzyme
MSALLAPFADRWATLLRTRKRDGSWVGTPVNLVVDGDRAYFSTPATAAKVKRLRNFSEVEVVPCTVRGRPIGAPVAARARRLTGHEEQRAHQRLRSRHPIVFRIAAPMELRMHRTHGVYYELADFAPLPARAELDEALLEPVVRV